MMLRQNASALQPNTRTLQHTPLRLAVRRCVATEQETAASAASDGSEATIRKTLSALDSLVPPAPEEPKPAVTDTPSASSSGGSSSIWQNEAVSSSTLGPRQTQNNKPWFEQVMGFESLAAAAEIINGRAAMLGFLAAVIKETHGDSVFSQLVSGGGVSALQISLLVVLASLAPAVRQVPFDKMFGKDKQPTSFGPFTPAAELINGRAAMLGLLALVFIEGSNGQPFFM